MLEIVGVRSRKLGIVSELAKNLDPRKTMDFIYVGLTVLLVATTFGLVQLCERV